MEATYPIDDLKQALENINWDILEVHQTVEDDHSIQSLSPDDVEPPRIENGRTIVEVTSPSQSQAIGQNTMLLGKFESQLETALRDLDTPREATVMQDGDRPNVFAVYSVESAGSNRRPHQM